jgi:catalase
MSAKLTNATGAPIADNANIMTAGPRGPALLQDIWLIEKLAQCREPKDGNRETVSANGGFLRTVRQTSRSFTS